MTNYYKDHYTLYSGNKNLRKEILNFLSNSRNSNILNSIAGLIGIVAGLYLFI